MENSIEEDIKILERFKNDEMQRDKLERDGRCGGWKIGDVYKQLELNNAIDHILSDYKRVLKENEELKIDNDIMKQDLNGNILYVDELEENYIPIKKIKDKIEELDNQQKRWLEDRKLKASDREIIFARYILQELLEDNQKIKSIKQTQ